MIRGVVPEMAVGLTHASIVIALLKRREGESGTKKAGLSKALPTFPGAKMILKPVEPLFESQPSRVLLSPRHQVTRPVGGGVQSGSGFTVREAFELVMGPAALLMTTEYGP